MSIEQKKADYLNSIRTRIAIANRPIVFTVRPAYSNVRLGSGDFSTSGKRRYAFSGYGRTENIHLSPAFDFEFSYVFLGC